MDHGGPVGSDEPAPTGATPDGVTAEPASAPAVEEPPAGPGTEGRRRRRWPLWTALVAVLLTLSVGVPVVLLAGGASDVEVGEPATAASPTENPTTAAARQVAERITAQLDKQAAALLGGDRSAFAAIAATGVRPELRRRFDALKALRVVHWQGRPSGLPTSAGRAGEWRVSIEFQYCFVVRNCQPSPVVVETRWRDGAEPRLLTLLKSKSSAVVNGRYNGQPGVLPWEVSKLAVLVGKRVMVASTPAHRDRLPGLLKRAEAAAKVADGYVVTGAPPDLYRVFYAGPKEWERWYGGDQPEWGAGYAVNVGGGHHEVVLAPETLDYGPGLDELLRHELAHTASLPDKDYWDNSAWWLIEGLAEHAGADGRSVARYEGLVPTRRLVRGDWDGKLDKLIPADDAPHEEVTGNYGIAYLAFRHLVDRFGEERAFAFFKAVVYDLRLPAQTTEEIFGQSWASLRKECVAYVRKAVR
ncbi:hypothetical protein O7605_06905 [Verrucosispora sp. WMMA2121]|uniref:hypothetical protein n=1 Tax=Verrucosispora sp. WMMA2121 TaxID=3015164 RepID=UPI0022B676CA|nr:hypothetical protein [Verrucosispora sp. WMMA2121]MCZ7419246.1 hypothetical protein [Verrucosispora sp. WMMA2121]